MAEANESAPKALVIDDEPRMTELLTVILELRGFVVLGAADGKKGLEALEREHFDLVFLDDVMPGLHGGEVYSLMKENEATKTIPVILMTAVAGYLLEQRLSLFPNVEAYLVKPFSPEDVLNAVDMIFEDSSPTGDQ